MLKQSLQQKLLQKLSPQQPSFAPQQQLSPARLEERRVEDAERRKRQLAADYSAGDGNPPLADDDLADWNSNELSLLPNGDATINCTPAGNCTITISWSDAQGDPNVPTPTTTLNGNI